MITQKQQSLLAIVQSWNITTIPEYRGFRCGLCQRYINEAWHHMLTTGGYLVPDHLCEGCEGAFNSRTVSFDQKSVPEKRLSHSYPAQAEARFKEIISTWPVHDTPVYKPFTCDDCSKNLDIDETDGMRKGFHVWWKMEGEILVELHFHRHCADRSGIQ